MGGLGTYILRLWDRASKGSVLLTDRLTIIVGPFATVAVWVFRKDMQESLPEILAVGIALTVFGVVFLRLLASPYLVWKDQNAAIANLDVELSRPEYKERLWLANYLAETRADLGKAMSKLVVFAKHKGFWDGYGVHEIYDERAVEYTRTLVRVRELIDELSYFPGIEEKGGKLIETSAEIIEIIRNEKIPNKALLKRMQSENREFIKLLHHK